MSEVVYDVPISEAAKILEKSDRQVRRYVKEKRLNARPVRIDGHIKLMFSRDELDSYRERLIQGEYFGETGNQIIADTHLIDEAVEAEVIEVVEEPEATVTPDVDMADSDPVKYAINALTEQIRELRRENKDLHYQLEQRSGQVGFLQGRVESLQEEIKMLMPASKAEDNGKKPWYKRIFGKS